MYPNIHGDRARRIPYRAASGFYYRVAHASIEVARRDLAIRRYDVLIPQGHIGDYPHILGARWKERVGEKAFLCVSPKTAFI